MTFSLKIEGTEYELWLGENAPILLFEALGMSFDSAFPSTVSNEGAIAGSLDETTISDSLKPQTLFNKLKTFDVRNAIASIILEEGEFTPEITFNSAKLARRFEISYLLTLIGDIFTEYNERVKLAEIAPRAESAEASLIVGASDAIPIASSVAPTINVAEGEQQRDAIS